MNSTGVLYSSSSSKYAELKNLLADLDLTAIYKK